MTFEEDQEIQNPNDTRYDDVLMIWLTHEYVGAQNEFLRERIRHSTGLAPQIIGQPEELVPCPCCGYCTLGSRGDYSICGVCWWEDDGQDNDTAEQVKGGPNYHLSLTRARINFLTHGISDPNRCDLTDLRQPSDKYKRGRTFVLGRGDGFVEELEVGWRSSLDGEQCASSRIANQLAQIDENEAIFQYVCRHFPDLLSPLERRSGLVGNGMYQPGSSADRKATILCGPVDLDELKLTLADGHDTLRARVAQRVLADHAGVLNRCPKCERVVRTPRAKQCLRCGHDWH